MLKLIFTVLLTASFYSFGFGQDKLTVYIFMAEECPVCNYLGKTLKKLSTQYESEVNFVAVFPQRMSNIKSASIFKQKYDLKQFAIEIDHDRSITDKYNATITPEVVIVNSRDEVLYQGRINDSYAAPGRIRHGRVTQDLELALKRTLSHRAVPKPWPLPIGCYITKI
ncbi:MAG: thiol-disulfide isomerase/thioredoxin [Saprospiraceae bacterium]|jgi:thiol-disulfide isomerase/thioredoxin